VLSVPTRFLPWRLHAAWPALLLLAASGHALAFGPVEIGVITSRSGTAQAAGATQALAATAWGSRMRAAGGIFGVPVTIRLADDGGVPARAASEARDLIEAGVHALVCCTTQAASLAVAEVAEATGVTLLSPTPLDGFGASGRGGVAYWSFALSPSETDALAMVVSDAAAAGRGAVALMTLDNSFGDAALHALEALLGYAGLGLSSVTRYPPGPTELRPEALLLASRQPGAVVVWGLADDLSVAVLALRTRGYEGLVYARTALLAPGTDRPSWAALAETRFAVIPGLVASSLPDDYICLEAVLTAQAQLSSVFSGVADLGAAAPVVDALALLGAAVEQVVALQLPAVSLAVERQALRDGLVALDERCGASGLLDLTEGRLSAVVPRGLVPAHVTPQGLRALP